MNTWRRKKAKRCIQGDCVEVEAGIDVKIWDSKTGQHIRISRDAFRSLIHGVKKDQFK